MKQQEDFITVELPNNSVGILRMVGEREFVVNIWMEKGGKQEDNEKLVEDIKSVYEEYYKKVMSYQKEDV